MHGAGLSAVLARAACFVGLWLVLAGPDIADLPAILIAAGAATWASLRLLPPQGFRLAPVAATVLALRFIRQSMVAGVDVSWRALMPRMTLRPGLVEWRPVLPPGQRRNAFCSLMSLLPGSLPAGPDEAGAIVIHCLDVTQPVAQQMTAEEALFIRATGGGHQDG